MKPVLNSLNQGAARVFAFTRAAVLVAISVTLTLFTIQNLAPFELRFATWSVRAPGAIVIFGIFVLGALFGFLAKAMAPTSRDGALRNIP